MRYSTSSLKGYMYIYIYIYGDIEYLRQYKPYGGGGGGGGGGGYPKP